MELYEALRGTGAVRAFTDEPVSDGEVAELLEAARFAPSGGNRQAWRVLVVRDPELLRGLRDLYVPPWHDYLALAAAGLTPWAPLSDRELEAAALEAPRGNQDAARDEFARNLDRVPALLVILADLRRLAAMDRDSGRYTLVGGASVYPFVWSILLAARGRGLGGVITTMLTRAENAVRDLLEVPSEYAVAAALAIGHPVHQPTRLRRAAVSEFATLDRFGGPPLADPARDTP
jgi:nitroreductase